MATKRHCCCSCSRGTAASSVITVFISALFSTRLSLLIFCILLTMTNMPCNAFLTTTPTSTILLRQQHHCHYRLGGKPWPKTASSSSSSTQQRLKNNDKNNNDPGNNKINNEDYDDGPTILTNCIDFIIALFTPASSSSLLFSFPPPVGFILVWLALTLTAPLSQVLLTLALYFGSTFLIRQLEFQDDDDDLLMDRKDDSTGNAINGEKAVVEVSSSQSPQQPPSTMTLVDQLCFVASLALGIILTVSFPSGGGGGSSSTNAVSSSAWLDNMKNIATNPIVFVAAAVASSLLLVSTILNNKNNPIVTSNDSSDKNNKNPNQRLLELWDEQWQLQQQKEQEEQQPSFEDYPLNEYEDECSDENLQEDKGGDEK